MKTFLNITLWLAATVLIARSVSAEDFAIEPIGFTSGASTSTDGNFTVSGTLTPGDGAVMSGGDFAIAGEFRTVILASPPDNLLPYGNAEGLTGGDGYTPVGALPGWKLAGNLRVIRWNTGGGFPVGTDPGPKDRGENFFAGGPDAETSTATIVAVLPVSSSRIDAGLVAAELSGWLGGYATQEDATSVTATFIDAAGARLESFSVGPVTAEMRENQTALLHVSAARLVPANARQVEVVLEMKRVAGNYNDGYADNLSLILRDATTLDPANLPPLADAGVPQTKTVSGGERIVLDGSGSKDPEGAPLSYIWRQVSGPALTFTDGATARPAFTAPAVTVSTTFAFELVVRDGLRDSAPSRTEVTLKPPTAPGTELIVNGSFENAQETFVRDGFGLMSLPSGSGAIPGWTTTTAELAWVDNANTFGAATPFGNHSLDLTGYHDGRPYAGVTQTIPTVPGGDYRLSLSLGSNVNYGGLKIVSVSAGSAATLFTLAPTNTIGNQWSVFSFTFTAAAPSTDIAIFGIAGGAYLGLDNVSVVAEPNSVTPPHSQELVTNGSFEIPHPATFVLDGNGIMILPPGASDIPGWTTTSAELAWGINGNAFGPSSPYGLLFLDLTGYHDAPPYGGITQTLATTPGETYRLSFALGSDEDRTVYRGPVSVDVTVGATSRSFTFSPTGTGNQWETFTLDFTATSASTSLTITGTESAGGAHLGLDNISVLRATDVETLPTPVVSLILDELKVSFPVEPGRTCAVEGRPDLSVGEWVIVPGTTRASAGASYEVSLPFRASQPQQFYRVRQFP